MTFSTSRYFWGFFWNSRFSRPYYNNIILFNLIFSFFFSFFSFPFFSRRLQPPTPPPRGPGHFPITSPSPSLSLSPFFLFFFSFSFLFSTLFFLLPQRDRRPQPASTLPPSPFLRRRPGMGDPPPASRRRPWARPGGLLAPCARLWRGQQPPPSPLWGGRATPGLRRRQAPAHSPSSLWPPCGGQSSARPGPLAGALLEGGGSSPLPVFSLGWPPATPVVAPRRRPAGGRRTGPARGLQPPARV